MSTLEPTPSPTPLVELTGLKGLPGGVDLPRGARLFAKLESGHPGGSIKDRPVARILREALAAGRIGRRRVLDSSSGNAGIAYAHIGARLGLEVTLVVPGNASAERLARIAAHGAELVLTDPVEGYDFAVRHARELAAQHPDRYWYADQYGNEDNWLAHYHGTGGEIATQVHGQTGAPPDAFVAGIGTGGTLTGVGRRLRTFDPNVLLGTVSPETFPGIEGLKPLGDPGDLVPEILDQGLIRDREPVSSEEAVAVCHLLARRGLFVGPSSGANVLAATRIAARHGARRVATILCDTGERYLSSGMWSARPRAARTQSGSLRDAPHPSLLDR